MSDSLFLDAALPVPAPAEARYVWAKVTQVSPLRIQLDGDRTPLGITPDDLGGVGSRAVDQRVYCQILNRRLVVLGPSSGGLPPGSVTATASGTLALGWLWCQGQAVSRTAYAALFAQIGTIYGVGDNTTTFNLPNLQGRVIVMADGTTEFTALGKTGGAKTHLLTAAEMPSHTHVQNAHNHAQDTHFHTSLNPLYKDLIVQSGSGNGSMWGGPDQSLNTNAVAATNQAATAVNQNTGGGGAHNNLQPYLSLYYMIKT